MRRGGGGDARKKLDTFFDKNNSKLSIFRSDIIRFQEKRRKVLYDPDRDFKEDIIIHSPFITYTETNARLQADISINSSKRRIWCETSKEYAEFLVSERADAFLCAILPYAMRSGHNIICESTVTEELLHNINEVLVPQLSDHDPRLYKSKVKAQGDSSVLVSAGGVATGMSCGVDSLYTAHLYRRSPYKSMNLTHLYVGNYLYGNNGPTYDRYNRVAEYMGLPIVATATNINQEVDMVHLHTHFFKTIFGVLALKKLFRIYYYTTTEDFSKFTLKGNGSRDTNNIELLLLYVFSDSSMSNYYWWS